jgi:hypothetical protein
MQGNKTPSLYHLVSARWQCLGYRKAQRIGGLDGDDQLKLGWIAAGLGAALQAAR